jgi:hypothetical protein
MPPADLVLHTSWVLPMDPQDAVLVDQALSSAGFGIAGPGLGQALTVALEGLLALAAAAKGGQGYEGPGWQVRVKPVVDPEAGAAVAQDATFPQDGEVAGDLGLRQFQGLGQFADTAFLPKREQHQNTQPGQVSEGTGEVFRVQSHVPA